MRGSDALGASGGEPDAVNGPNLSPDASRSVFGPNSNESFESHIRRQGRLLWRDLPWRRTHDPYAVWLSEVMLQQTQVPRVIPRWEEWLLRYPTVEALAAAEQADVLSLWQGLGYNRRALMLHRAAGEIARLGEFPTEEKALRALPGIGPATAAGIRAFAFDLPGVYLETNVRTVYLHEFFPDAEKVPDSALVPLIQDTLSASDVRGWYWALLDYGAHLKRVLPNPSRRSASHTRQSRFEGSRRQKRAEILRILLEAKEAGMGVSAEDAATALTAFEVARGREPVSAELAASILRDLAREGFCRPTGDLWTC